MELFSAEFFAALAAIIVIDLVLAGDNAIVIALAARSLPAHLQRRAVLWGTAGAIAVRSFMTLAVVWLLNIPGLLLAGGLLLLWIAYRLLSPEDKGSSGAEKALAPARALLAKHAVPFTEHVRVGDKAATIVEEATRLRCDRIVMATARRNSFARMLPASVTSGVLDRASCPVEVISGNADSPLERYGISAGFGAAITLLMLAAG